MIRRTTRRPIKKRSKKKKKQNRRLRRTSLHTYNSSEKNSQRLKRWILKIINQRFIQDQKKAIKLDSD